MITSNDLFDIYYSLLLIRNDINNKLNVQLLKSISDAIISKSDSENKVRIALSKIENINSEKWYFCFSNNVYTFRYFITDEKTLDMLCKIITTLSDLILENKWEQAYDFVDSIHFVPILIEQDKVFSPRKIKKATKAYRKKWKVKSVF